MPLLPFLPYLPLLPLLLGACAPKHLLLPTGPGAPFADFAPVFEQAASRCAGTRTLTAELAVSGHAGAARLRGRVIAGLERPGALRLEGVAPFGPPVFILVARNGTATLFLERDNRVLSGARPADVLAALTGVELTPDDLRAVLAGCVSADAAPRRGSSFEGRWLKVDLAAEKVAYLRQAASGWRIEAGEIGDLVIEYGAFEQDMPREIRLWSPRRPAAGGQATDLRVILSQVEINIAIAPAAFTLSVPADAVPLTLEELRDAGPLGTSPGGKR